MADGRFRNRAKPDPEVVGLLERVLESARNGQISTILIVASNPLHDVETATAGDISGVRATVMLGGLSLAAQKLLKERS